MTELRKITYPGVTGPLRQRFWGFWGRYLADRATERPDRAIKALRMGVDQERQLACAEIVAGIDSRPLRDWSVLTAFLGGRVTSAQAQTVLAHSLDGVGGICRLLTSLEISGSAKEVLHNKLEPATDRIAGNLLKFYRIDGATTVGFHIDRDSSNIYWPLVVSGAIHEIVSRNKEVICLLGKGIGRYYASGGELKMEKLETLEGHHPQLWYLALPFDKKTLPELVKAETVFDPKTNKGKYLAPAYCALFGFEYQVADGLPSGQSVSVVITEEGMKNIETKSTVYAGR